ncbi:hypothetical protein B0H17DRAFT_1151459 [Mycena rosella]|uniref:Uncharacterized protein n=1 Tax=Mycena rosella TaxID=1033263 RepID=A0AAD7BLA3_MYCRO|nr:hypothetical protein B0H17DRAFT_1151459 [Mycena rosella]
MVTVHSPMPKTSISKTLEPGFKAYMVAESKGDKNEAQQAAKKWKDDNVPNILRLRSEHWRNYPGSVQMALLVQQRWFFLFPIAVPLGNCALSHTVHGHSDWDEFSGGVLPNFTWPSDNVYASVPYSEIAKQADNFYHTNLFGFKLDTVPTEMSLSCLSGIIEHLIAASATDVPFVFRTREDIVARQGSNPAISPSPIPTPLLPNPPSTPRPESPPLPSPSPLHTELPPLPPSSTPHTVSPSSLLPPPLSPVENPEIPPEGRVRKRKAPIAVEPADVKSEEPAQGRGKRTKKSPQEAEEERVKKAAEAAAKAQANETKGGEKVVIVAGDGKLPPTAVGGNGADQACQLTISAAPIGISGV